MATGYAAAEAASVAGGSAAGAASPSPPLSELALELLDPLRLLGRRFLRFPQRTEYRYTQRNAHTPMRNTPRRTPTAIPMLVLVFCTGSLENWRPASCATKPASAASRLVLRCGHVSRGKATWTPGGVGTRCAELRLSASVPCGGIYMHPAYTEARWGRMMQCLCLCAIKVVEYVRWIQWEYLVRRSLKVSTETRNEATAQKKQMVPSRGWAGCGQQAFIYPTCRGPTKHGLAPRPHTCTYAAASACMLTGILGKQKWRGVRCTLSMYAREGGGGSTVCVNQWDGRHNSVDNAYAVG